MTHYANVGCRAAGGTLQQIVRQAWRTRRTAELMLRVGFIGLEGLPFVCLNRPAVCSPVAVHERLFKQPVTQRNRAYVRRTSLPCALQRVQS